MRLTTLTVLSVAALTSAEMIQGLVKRTTSTTVNSNSQLCGCFKLNLGIFTSGNLNDICLCEKDIEDFVSGGSNGACNQAKKVIGTDQVAAIISGLLKSCQDKETCTLPEHSKSSCSSSNKCNYDCTDGYEKDKNGQCSCPSSKSVCNGQCRSSCPSGRSLPEKRDLVYWGKQTQRTCQSGWKACGVPGGGPRDWECIDVKDDLWSCGDCPFDVMVSPSGTPGRGVDCTSIPGVSDVGCSAGRCVIRKCMSGYKVSSNGHDCEVDHSFQVDA
ncbi:hypothetical protein GYMLUDRAFT_241830 [Collybiopsis luxurians FD-317 M1]|uniref:Unplaced genomic scaffold GYMLUscaffold_16, whole genome shotgun sequence n=1 Tax=Collybiopsis luxurians FD-317 M1 TaxID=944289 RepID=A0A0D0C5B9_9AGAR|nr:hypothetical protein GYMLUDRAFT_241830 [Collybiopsis luxurians FD-317 M1]